MTELTKIIPLTKGKFVLVDASDYDYLMQWKWQYVDNSYAARCPRNGMIYMHRLIVCTPKGAHTDHINGDKLDNRRCNLRICTHAQNNMNQKKTKGISKYKGVSWIERLNKWRAYIMKDSKQQYLGVFNSEDDAATAYNTAALREFRQFAKLNLIGAQNGN